MKLIYYTIKFTKYTIKFTKYFKDGVEKDKYIKTHLINEI